LLGIKNEFEDIEVVMVVFLLSVALAAYHMGGLGAGDIKLLTIVTIFLMGQKVLLFWFLSFSIAYFTYGLIWWLGRSPKEKNVVPMAFPICISYLLIWGGIIK